MISVEQFASGFERSVHELPILLDEWEAGSIDEDLQFEYKEQFEWLIGHRDEFLEKAKTEGVFETQGARIVEANEKLADLWPRIEKVMGVKP